MDKWNSVDTYLVKYFGSAVGESDQNHVSNRKAKTTGHCSRHQFHLSSAKLEE